MIWIRRCVLHAFTAHHAVFPWASFAEILRIGQDVVGQFVAVSTFVVAFGHVWIDDLHPSTIEHRLCRGQVIALHRCTKYEPDVRISAVVRLGVPELAPLLIQFFSGHGYVGFPRHLPLQLDFFWRTTRFRCQASHREPRVQTSVVGGVHVRHRYDCVPGDPPRFRRFETPLQKGGQTRGASLSNRGWKDGIVWLECTTGDEGYTTGTTLENRSLRGPLDE